MSKHIFAIEEALKDHNMPQEVLVWGLPKGGHTLPPRNNITLLVFLNREFNTIVVIELMLGNYSQGMSKI